jgi:hypothetical protein
MQGWDLGKYRQIINIHNPRFTVKCFFDSVKLVSHKGAKAQSAKWQLIIEN